MSSLGQKWRQELYFKSQSELQNIAQFLKSHNIKQVNLTNKKKEDDLINWVRALKQSNEDLDVCVHYSIKWNYKGALQPSFQAFAAFCQDMKEFSNCSILLLSGTGPKKKFNSVEALKMMKRQQMNVEVPIFVAFNPYLPELEVEKERLMCKLQTDLVSGVYLQTGSNLIKLREGLEFVSNFIKQTNRDLSIIGSIFVADAQFLQQMKFRPWNGVFLSEEYLSCVESAHLISTQVLEIYQEYSVLPIVETPVKNERQLCLVQQFLKQNSVQV